MLETLQTIGLSEKQAKVYLACLELGRGSVVAIAKRAAIKRTTVYNILEELMDERLVSKYEDTKGQKFLAESPEKLKTLLQERQNELEKVIPNLLAMASSEGSIKPEVKFYQGKEGIKAVYEDTLESCQKGDEIVAFFSGEDIFGVLPVYIEDYITRRKTKGVKMRGIGPESDILRRHQSNDAKELRQTKIVNQEILPITIEKNIYQDKVALMNFRAWPMGIIIKSPQIARSERAIFELLWGLV